MTALPPFLASNSLVELILISSPPHSNWLILFEQVGNWYMAEKDFISHNLNLKMKGSKGKNSSHPGHQRKGMIFFPFLSFYRITVYLFPLLFTKSGINNGRKKYEHSHLNAFKYSATWCFALKPAWNSCRKFLTCWNGGLNFALVPGSTDTASHPVGGDKQCRKLFPCNQEFTLRTQNNNNPQTQLRGSLKSIHKLPEGSKGIDLLWASLNRNG